MKLYAKTTSERASKGQGGNEYICIKLTVQNGSKLDYPIGEIVLEYRDDVETHQVNQNEWILKYIPHNRYDAEIIDQGNVEPPKGEKQKSENPLCKHCGLTQTKGTRKQTRDFVLRDVCVGCARKHKD